MKFLCIRDMQVLVDITEYIKPIFLSNLKIASRDYRLCVKHSNLNTFIMKTILAVYIGVALFYQIPTYMHLAITGDFAPPLGIYLPGLGTEKWTHCLILLLFNFAPLLVCISCLVAFDAFVYIIFNNMFMVSKIITSDIDEFGMMLSNKSIAEKEMKRRLISIIQLHVDYNA